MLFKKLKEQQSLINANRKSLADAEEKIEKLSDALEVARHNNTVLLERNKKQAKTLKSIKELTEINKYNHEENIFEKIKELISDGQSQN